MITTCSQHSWTAPDGEIFSYSRWEAGPANAGEPPVAVMVAVHGLSGAALDFEPLGAHLSPQGVTTYAPELRGQGNDPRPDRRGDLEKIDDWFADLEAFLALVHRQHPGVALFCYGESMGAALLVRFFGRPENRWQPDGLVLASPVVTLPRRPAWWQEKLFLFLLALRPRQRINVRKLSRSKPVDAIRIVTRDEAHRKWFETASHRVDRFTLRFFHCLVMLIDGCIPAAGRLQVPLLVLYAANDLFIAPARVEEFFEKIGSRDKEHVFFPESYHLLLHDHDRALVLARIEEWLLPRLEGRQRVLASGTPEG